MASIYLQLNIHKKYHDKLLKNNQETNTTSEKLEDKTKSILINQHNIINNNNNNNNNNNIKKVRNNYYLKRYENYFHKKLVIKYNVLPQEYNQMQLDNFITAKYCHNLATFKEKLIYFDYNEFLKMYYKMKIIRKELPKLIDFYKNYLNFFCFPTFTELKLNDFIEKIIEKKAKAFYSENYKDEEKKNKIKNLYNYTEIFTKKVKHELSRRDTLIELSKTTIKNKESNKNTLTSISTLNKIIDGLDEKQTIKNVSIKKINKNNDLILLNKEENYECQTERIKGIEMTNNIALSGKAISKNYSNCSTEMNYKNKIINIKKSITKNMKYKINNKCKLSKLMKNQNLLKQLNQQNNFIKKQINNIKKTSENKNIKENKKTKNSINLTKEKNEDNKSKNIKKKNNKNNLIIKLIKFDNLQKIKSNIVNKIEKGNGNYTTREKKNSLRNINKNNSKIKLVKFDQKFQSFLKIALDFNKSPPKNRQTLCFKRPNQKHSSISVTDRNKSNKSNKSYKLRNKINSCIKNSIKKDSISKISIKKNINKQQRLKPLSRNYKVGFEDIKTTIIKTTLRNKLNNKVIFNTNIINNSGKKTINNKINTTLKITNTKNKKAQKSFISKKENKTFTNKKIFHLTSSNLSKIFLNSKNKKKNTKMKSINLKKSVLTLNKLVTRTMNSSKNHGMKMQKSLSEIKIPII